MRIFLKSPFLFLVFTLIPLFVAYLAGEAILSWLFDYAGPLLIGVPGTIMLSTATALALLRHDPKVSFVRVLTACSAVILAVSGGGSILFFADIVKLEWSYVAEALTGLLSGIVFAGILYAGVAALTSSVRTRRFALRWFVGVALTWTVVIPIAIQIGNYADDAPLALILKCLLLPLVSAAVMINVLASQPSARPIGTAAALQPREVRLILKGISAAVVLVIVSALGWQAWIRTTRYQLRRISDTAYKRITGSSLDNAAWVRLAAHVALKEDALAAVPRLYKSWQPLAFAYLADEDPDQRTELHRRAGAACDDSVEGRDMTCLADSVRQLESHGQTELAGKIREMLSAEWSRRSEKMIAEPNPANDLMITRDLLQHAKIAGREHEAAALWQRSIEATQTLTAYQLDSWVRLLQLIPPEAAMPTYEAIRNVLRTGSEGRRYNEVFGGYSGLMRAGRCKEALNWLDMVPGSPWKDWDDPLTDFEKESLPANPECLHEWTDFLARHSSELGNYSRARLYGAVISRMAQSGNPKEAIAALQQAGGTPDAYPESFAHAYLALKEYEKAIEHAKRFQMNDAKRGTDLLASIYTQMVANHLVDQKLLDRVRELSPYEGVPILALAGAELVASGEREPGIKLLDESQEQLLTSSTSSLRRFDAAVAFSKSRRCRAAVTLLENSMASEPVDVELLANAYVDVFDVCSGRKVTAR